MTKIYSVGRSSCPRCISNLRRRVNVKRNVVAAPDVGTERDPRSVWCVECVYDECPTCHGRGTVDNDEVWYPGCDYDCERDDGGECEAGRKPGALRYYRVGSAEVGWYCDRHRPAGSVRATGWEARGGELAGQDPCPECTSEGELESPSPRGSGRVNPRLRAVHGDYGDSDSTSLEAPNARELLDKIGRSDLLTSVEEALLLGQRVERVARGDL